ncbi:MAG: thioesterase family protein [Bacteroidota bacterium]
MNYPVKVDIDVAWGEMDAFGHVNNIIYFRYFETSRMAYFQKTGMLQMMEKDGIGPILAHTSCQFKTPLVYPDQVTCQARVKKVGNTSFVMEYYIENQAGKAIALGEGVLVMHNYKTAQNVQIPENIRSAILNLENGNLAD